MNTLIPEQWSWDDLANTIVNDLDFYLKQRKLESLEPHSVIISGSMGGAICAGIALANLKTTYCRNASEKESMPADGYRMGDHLPVFLFTTREVNSAAGPAPALSPTKENAFRAHVTATEKVVLLIESTRQQNSPLLFIEEECVRQGKILLAYAFVYVNSSGNTSLTPTLGKMSIVKPSVDSKYIKFPWHLT